MGKEAWSVTEEGPWELWIRFLRAWGWGEQTEHIFRPERAPGMGLGSRVVTDTRLTVPPLSVVLNRLRPEPCPIQANSTLPLPIILFFIYSHSYPSQRPAGVSSHGCVH